MPAVLDKPLNEKGLTKYVEPGVFLRDPLRMFDWMREEMDRLFDITPFARLVPTTREPLWMPALEMFDKDGNLHVKADLPGLKKEDITIDVTAEGLTIKGERKAEFKEEKKDEGYFRTERVYGEFCRFVPLPEGASVDKIDAVFKDGVLELIVPVPKLEKLVPKKVEIK
jgi:HSP20 family protein